VVRCLLLGLLLPLLSSGFLVNALHDLNICLFLCSLAVSVRGRRWLSGLWFVFWGRSLYLSTSLIPISRASHPNHLEAGHGSQFGNISVHIVLFQYILFYFSTYCFISHFFCLLLSRPTIHVQCSGGSIPLPMLRIVRQATQCYPRLLNRGTIITLQTCKG
jgi:hypothetical protein